MLWTKTLSRWMCLSGTGAVLAMMLVSALAPVTNWDAGVAHLALPSDYVRDGRIHLLTGNVYSAYPQALHCLFTYAFYMSGERGVMLFCWTLSVLACGTLYCVGARIGGRRAGILAITFLGTAPIFISQAGTVSIDLPFAGVVLGVVLSLVIWQQERGMAWLVIAGVLAGYGCGIRHTGYVVLALCALGVLLEGRNVKWASIFLLIGLGVAAPWFMRSYLLVGNPVYPLLGSVFVDETFAYHQATGLGVHESIRETSVFGFATFSWDMVMHPERYDGWNASPGGWVWILGIPGLILGGRVARWIGLFSLAGVSSLYMVQRLVRYGIPFFVPMMAVAGVAGSRLSEKSRVLSGLIVLGLAYGCALTAGSMYFKIPVVLGMESRDEYLTKRVERYAAFKWMNENLPEDAVVLTLDLRSYYIDRPTFQNTESLRELIPLDFADKAEWLLARDIQYLFVPDDVVPTTAGMGLKDELETWGSAPDHFRPIHQMEIPRARGEGTEHVTIYEVIGAGARDE